MNTILFVFGLCPPGGHASGDIPAGTATGTRKGERETEDGIASAKKHSHKQVFPFTKRGGEEELLLFFVWWGLKKKNLKKKLTDKKTKKQDEDMKLLKGPKAYFWLNIRTYQDNINHMKQTKQCIMAWHSCIFILSIYILDV